MNILIPMAGAGSRFQKVGYTVSKPAIPTYDKRTGKLLPMVVCACLDLPSLEENGANVIFVERTFHRENGTENEIKKFFSQAKFLTVDQLTEGQACTCLLAKNLIDNDEELLIAGCDNGMEFDEKKFDELRQSDVDLLVFTYRHDECVLENPNAYGWMVVDAQNNIVDVSIKKAISDHPEEDHAVVATFYFKKGHDFVRATEKMIAENDRVNGEFYVDEVVRHALKLGLKAKVFEIEKYLCWGTPADFEKWQKTFEYWHEFYLREKNYIEEKNLIAEKNFD